MKKSECCHSVLWRFFWGPGSWVCLGHDNDSVKMIRNAKLGTRMMLDDGFLFFEATCLGNFKLYFVTVL